MKKYILMIFLALSTVLSATKYYVAPAGGSDINAGTNINYPWATFQKAINTAQAGDTVYFRGGIYSPSTYRNGSDIFYYCPSGLAGGNIMTATGHNGTRDKRIYYMNYPGEKPIFDLSGCVPSGQWNVGLYMAGVEYVTFKGLTFQGLRQTTFTGPATHVINASGCSNLRFENMVIRNNGGAGIRYFGGMSTRRDMKRLYGINVYSDSTYFINCDFINNVNYGGGHGDGAKLDQDKGAYFYVSGNRFMFNADDGLDISGSAVAVVRNNWSFGNGVNGGDGNGFKLGAVRDSTPYPLRIIVNNLAAFNYGPTRSAGGFDFPDYVDETDSTYQRANARIYNNTSYHNDIGFLEFENKREPYRNDVYRNNIAYDNQYIQDVRVNVSILYYPYRESNNTWDYEKGGYSFVETDTVLVSDADFVMTDSTLAAAELLASRKPDGSLPDITFLRLAPGSDLIDAGKQIPLSDDVDFVLSYEGKAPDIGYSEYKSSSSGPSVPVYVRSVISDAAPAKIEMVYNLTLANIVPATSAFTVKVNNETRTVIMVNISGNKVILTLVSPAKYGDIVTVSYSAPDSNGLQTASGVDAVSITDMPVINNCSRAANLFPAVMISSPGNNSSFEAPATITLTTDASDQDGTVSKVEYFLGSAKVGESSAFPYSFEFKLDEAGTYEITAVATDNMNAVASSPSVRIFVSSGYDYTDHINLYPNPNNGQFSIELDSAIPSVEKNVAVTDYTGQIVYKGLLTSEEVIRDFNLAYIKTGTYVLIVSNGNKIVATEKFLKN